MKPERPANTRREVVESLLGSDCAARQEAFSKEISDLVASLAASDNRLSTALISKMEDAGMRELRTRADSILASSKRAIVSLPGIDQAGVSDSFAHASERLAHERTSIERVVLGVQMGSIPQHPGFLSETEVLLRKRFLAELQLLELQVGAINHFSDEIIELKPNFFGLGINLRALGRRITLWWKGR